MEEIHKGKGLGTKTLGKLVQKASRKFEEKSRLLVLLPPAEPENDQNGSMGIFGLLNRS